MTLDNTIKCMGREYRLISKGSQGSGEMYVFREIIHKGNGGIEELSDECKIFQVYRNNGRISVDSYNKSSRLVPKLKSLILNNFLN